MILDCCEFRAPLNFGESVAVLRLEAGTPNDMESMTVYVEPCAGYVDAYADTYSDPTEGGAYPDARVATMEFDIPLLRSGTTLEIDSARRRVRVTEDSSGDEVGGLETLDFSALWQWMEAEAGGCCRVCLDSTSGLLNANSTIAITTRDRER